MITPNFEFNARKFSKKILFRTDTLVLFSLFLLVTFFYRKAFSGYFQGDEWYYFSQYLPLAKNGGGLFGAISKSIFSFGEISGGGHLTPVYSAIWYIHNKFFGLHANLYIVASLVVHALNSFLIYLIVKKFCKNFIVALLSGFFFACSYQHFQAVTWIMAYVPTVYSVLFSLLSLYFLQWYCYKSNVIYILLTFIFLVLALLTKETAFIILVVSPIVVYFLKRKFFKKVVLFNVLTAISYIAFRFGMPVVLHENSSQNFLSVYTPQLFIFRLFTYPVRLLVEMYIPQEFVLRLIEYITPLGYPTYGAEKLVRGINFLTFTQGPGSDLFIYPAGVFFVLIILLLLFSQRRKKNIYNLVFIGLAIIFLSALPLLLIALYAPGWAYVTFIDSRHLYFPSIGGSMIFAALVYSITKYIKKYIDSNMLFYIWFVLIALWIYAQYFLLQTQLSKELLTGQQRKTVISKILTSVPEIRKDAFFLVQSNTGYYGFGPIPPFQTNLSQILAIQYFSLKQLPQEFLTDYSITSKGLSGEGILKHNDRQFGFFINQSTLINKLLDQKISKNDIYAFSWDGNANSISDISEDIRNKFNMAKSRYDKYHSWDRIYLSKSNIRMMVPRSFAISKPLLETNQQDNLMLSLGPERYQIIVWKKTVNKGIFEDIAFLNNSDGEEIGENFYYRDIERIDGEKIISRMSLKGSSMQYFLPTISSGYIVEVRVLDKSSILNGHDDFAEDLIRLFSNIDE